MTRIMNLRLFQSHEKKNEMKEVKGNISLENRCNEKTRL